MAHVSHLLGFFHVYRVESSLHIISWDDGLVTTPFIFATCSCTWCALLSAMERRSDWPEETVHELNLWVKLWIDKYIQGKVCWLTGFWCIPEQFTLSGWDEGLLFSSSVCSLPFFSQVFIPAQPVTSHSQKCSFLLLRTNIQNRSAPSPSLYPLEAGFSSFWKVTASVSQGRWGHALCSHAGSLCPYFP